MNEPESEDMPVLLDMTFELPPHDAPLTTSTRPPNHRGPPHYRRLGTTTEVRLHRMEVARILGMDVPEPEYIDFDDFGDDGFF